MKGSRLVVQKRGEEVIGQGCAVDKSQDENHIILTSSFHLFCLYVHMMLRRCFVPDHCLSL